MKISKITEKQSYMDPFGEVRQKDQWYWMNFNNNIKDNMSFKLSLKDLAVILQKSL